MSRILDKDIAKRLSGARDTIDRLVHEIEAIESEYVPRPMDPPLDENADTEQELLAAARNWYSRRFWINFMEDEDSVRLRRALHADWEARQPIDDGPRPTLTFPPMFVNEP